MSLDIRMLLLSMLLLSKSISEEDRNVSRREANAVDRARFVDRVRVTLSVTVDGRTSILSESCVTRLYLRYDLWFLWFRMDLRYSDDSALDAKGERKGELVEKRFQRLPRRLELVRSGRVLVELGLRCAISYGGGTLRQRARNLGRRGIGRSLRRAPKPLQRARCGELRDGNGRSRRVQESRKTMAS